MGTNASPERRDRSRRYPPLAGALGALALALFVLPSALNVPLSNPAQTLEFAPVPATDEDAPPPRTGNVGTLGLGSSSRVPAADARGGEDADVPLPPPPVVPEGTGERPVTKRCVGSPPRQTEDPLAPPCVGYFDGDNGGATSRGVTAEEVRVLVYMYSQNCDGTTKRGIECADPDSYWDLAEPPEDDEHFKVRVLRSVQAYFNDRFQTYGRFVHVWVYFDRGTDSATPEARRADAVGNLEEVDPFAVIAYPRGADDAYIEAMADAGVLVFGSREPHRAEFYQRRPGLIWSYAASIEQQARLFADWVCTKIVPFPVSFSDNDDLGQQRVLGLLRTRDERSMSHIWYAEEASRRIEACGGAFAHEATFPNAGYINDVSSDEHNVQEAAANMARFQQQDVTTIVWPQGYDTEHTKAAATIGYRPEWVVGGDVIHESNTAGRYQEQSVWDRHAFSVTQVPYAPPLEETECYRAMKEAGTQESDGDIDYACEFWQFYINFRQLFTGIQVAGPRLSAATVDEGFHAIPAIPSDDRSVPACFYEPHDYTCVKDGMAQWWDATGQATAGSQPGCWRMIEDGLRHFAGQWPPGDPTEQWSDDDDCTNYSRAPTYF